MNKDRVAHLLPINYSSEGGGGVGVTTKENLLAQLDERIYVQNDKPYYYPGEQLWLKGYINYRSQALRDSLSRTVYVEFISPAKSILVTRTIRIDSGFFWGDMKLPDTLSPGVYSLRAYTNLNRNFGDSTLYSRPIHVVAIADKVAWVAEIADVANVGVVTIKQDKLQYQTREKVTLTIQLRDEDGQPLGAHLAMAVTDSTQVAPVMTSKSILDQWPFRKNIQSVSPDSLLFSVEYGLSLSGTFLNAKNQPLKTLLNVIQFKPSHIAMTQTNKEGRFSVNGFVFYDTALFSIAPFDKKIDGKVAISSRSVPPVYFTHTSVKLPVMSMQSPQRIWNEPDPASHMLDPVEVKAARIQEEYTPEYRIKRPYGRPNYVLKSKEINRSYGNLLLAIQGKFPGLVVRQASNPGAGASSDGSGASWVVYTTRSAAGSMSSQREVLVMVNDCFVGGSPAQILSQINPEMVESIELRTSVNVLYGEAGSAGILSIYTKTDLPQEIETKTNIPLVKVPGYAKPTVFRLPDYESERINDSKVDFRSLLYWNPKIKVNASSGEATVSFFTSDLTGGLHVELEGVTAEGKPVRATRWVRIVERK